MDQQRVKEEIVTAEDIHELLVHFSKTNHRVKNADIKGETVLERCIVLNSFDFQSTLIPNFQGELCSHYPMKLIIPEYEKDPNSTNDVQTSRCQPLLYQMIKNARCARCRTRFVVPAFLFRGKYICRSATLSGGAEMFGRSTTDYLLSNDNPPFLQGSSENGRVDMFGKFRGHDIQLLKHFDVKYICDLMVEKKKTKFLMPLTSSEKVDKESRYADFTILGMPYPGCEFFKDWKESHYRGDSIKYDWRLALNDSALDLPTGPIVSDLNIDWSKYKEWSLTRLTQNYFKLLLNYMIKGSSGLLIHCISGWDRTPLFVSLLRISLWADGLLHQSLNATELLYLTLGYDWYLFGHDLPDRISGGEEVLLFCFKTLTDIASEEYSLLAKPQATHTSNDASVPHSNPSATSLTNQCRVGSDSSFGIQGVLLDDCQMNFAGKGSTGSLNSLGSFEASDGINFTVGIPEEQRGGEGFDQEEDWLGKMPRNGSASSFGHKRRSMSPTTRRVSSPNLPHSSPVSARRTRRRSSDGQGLSVHSNHFLPSSAGRSSSPVVVPSRQGVEGGGSSVPAASHPQSIGSWQIIPSIEGLKLETPHSHSSTERSNSISENESLMNSIRFQRLEAVSRLFQTSYFSIAPSNSRSNSIGAGLTSFFDRIADSFVGPRGGGGGGAQQGGTRREL